MPDSIDFTYDLARFDFERIHSWLSCTYWSSGIPLERVRKGFHASTVVVAAFHADRQVGVARALSDTTRFAYIADVFVDPEFRGRGIARQMVRKILEHPLVSDADCCTLQTADAHGVYRALGFEVPETHGRWMRRPKPQPQQSV